MKADLDARGLIISCPECGQANRIPYTRLSDVPRCAKCRGALALPDAPIEIDSDAAFDALIQGSVLPVLVDFWAAWCGPCKMLAPELVKVAQSGVGQWLVAKVDTEHLPSLAQRFRVSSIPLLVLFRQGREVARQAGAMPAAGIRTFIQQA